MGILDDAIREHLELKRRHGSDPGEIERLEQEALGPVRRPGLETQDMPAGDEPALAPEYLDEEPELGWPEPPAEPGFVNRGGELLDDDEFEEWNEPPREPLGGVGVEPEAAPSTPVPTPPREPKPPPSRAPVDEDHIVHQETVEHDVEGEHAEEAGERPKRDDMLEETPEFLQDTPDHDRLWFEQRPPRDFDLDG